MFLAQLFQDAFKLRGSALDFSLSGFYVALRGLEQRAQLLILDGSLFELPVQGGDGGAVFVVEGMQRRLRLRIGRGGKAIDER
jgi:hypothetical protein